jgi:hypothetical protein
VNVSTDSFLKLTAEVERMADEVARLGQAFSSQEIVVEAIYGKGWDEACAAILRGHGRPRRPRRGERPGHLRLAGEGGPR